MSDGNLIAIGLALGFCASSIFWLIIIYMLRSKYESDYFILLREHFDLIEKCDRLGIER